MDESPERPALTFRPASESDTEFARDVHGRAYRDVVVQQFGSWDEERQAAFFDDAWSKPGFEIISMDGTDVGYRCVEVRDDAVVVHELVIVPEVQHHGIGTALLGEAQHVARALAKPLRLQVLKANQASELYGRLGFQVTGETDTHLEMEWTPGEPED